ncbi:hypothetical protein [Streptomyces pseudovenezuelae]|uniref:Uncharacterized protein n=1 Tax=Streptomyces pseudovenezuelae TaxID=67350 RepID=A0ABT6LAU5_9ACTN|nr:hypothetical protein [Streptomyces pseudovenezuelae]MDH6213442.1 hypothetical protein [Streptomyces pseudovenezuelae]
MTDRVDSVPDTGPINFKLWLPQWDSRHGRLRCRFQATTVGLTQLNEGTSECMTQFLADLGQTEANNITWSSERYRTTFLSDFPDANGWEDQLALAWDVQIETDSDDDPEDAGTHDPGPHGSHAYDSTFENEDEAGERLRDRVLIIAGTAYGPKVDLASLVSTEGVLSADIGIFEGMVALDLGVLDFPDDVALIDGVLARCREHGLRTNWKEPDY